MAWWNRGVSDPVPIIEEDDDIDESQSPDDPAVPRRKRKPKPRAASGR